MNEKQIVNELLDILDLVRDSENAFSKVAATERIETMIELLTSDRVHFIVKRWYE